MGGAHCGPRTARVQKTGDPQDRSSTQARRKKNKQETQNRATTHKLMLLSANGRLSCVAAEEENKALSLSLSSSRIMICLLKQGGQMSAG